MSFPFIVSDLISNISFSGDVSPGRSDSIVASILDILVDTFCSLDSSRERVWDIVSISIRVFVGF